jgi:serine/threonine-protein kinase
VGEKQGVAQQKISSAGFTVGDVREEYSDDVEKGYVIRQVVKAGSSAPTGTTIGIVVSKGPEDGQEYKGSYTFALEDLIDSDGNPITEGVVSVALDEVLQKIDTNYEDVSMWQGDYTMQFVGSKKGKATVELFVNGKSVIKDTVKLK